MSGTPECDVRGSRRSVWAIVTGAEFASADARVGVARTPRGSAGTLRDYWPWIAIPSASRGRGTRGGSQWRKWGAGWQWFAGRIVWRGQVEVRGVYEGLV
jgi:hypothetical protein